MLSQLNGCVAFCGKFLSTYVVDFFIDYVFSFFYVAAILFFCFMMFRLKSGMPDFFCE